jgi:uncharacterized repeat protein (TIGR03803 family)
VGGDDGVAPDSALVFDSQGNLYGETSAGGGSQNCASSGCGTVFKLTPGSNGTWSESILHSFAGSDGVQPIGGLISDTYGNLYGVTTYGGDNGLGVVFELSPTPTGSWSETTLYVFSEGEAEANPWGGLISDRNGNLFGTTSCISAGCAGGVFELTPVTGGGWSYNVLYQFKSGPSDGDEPFSGLSMDSQGNLYGTCYEGGTANEGTVFKLAPGAGGTWAESILYDFQDGTDGALPYSTPVFDTSGALYGTTTQGGWGVLCNPLDLILGCGTIYKLASNPNGSWEEIILHAFTGESDGTGPQASVILDTNENLYGTATYGGGGIGTVFKYTQ